MMHKKDMKMMGCCEPISGKPNIADDDPVNRGISGQCLYSKDMYYDPATGKSAGGMDVNLMDSVPVPAGPDAGYPMDMGYESAMPNQGEANPQVGGIDMGMPGTPVNMDY